MSRHDLTGTWTAPPVHESGRRTTWLRLHAAVTGNGEPGHGPDDLADDLELVAAALCPRR